MDKRRQILAFLVAGVTTIFGKAIWSAIDNGSWDLANDRFGTQGPQLILKILPYLVIFGVAWASVNLVWWLARLEQRPAESIKPIFGKRFAFGNRLADSVIIWFRTPPVALNLSFSMTDPGCVRRDVTITTEINHGGTVFVVGEGVKSDYYRLKVEATDLEVSAYLVAIKRGESLVFSGENLPLTFAQVTRGQPVTTKKVANGLTEYIDLIAITEKNEIILALPGLVGPSSVNQRELFSQSADYTLSVFVSSPGMSKTVTLLLRWFGNRTTAQLLWVDG
jgi:hypothetical protein